ncbi:uncharacterized protein DEA37_0004434 [Paragonimus westermani]|uniref:Endonuclease/exonuclease/phosphatase domain-containing protein n=1 Tax=Paragonimus westermani TaxID=34504 RepID=A0A5J4NLJ3_9TREM|nr:uncharacterized protein DEA37_0004434 [Paragonimus westermani]
MSFPVLDSFNPSSVHPKQGWTKKRFLEVYGELQELIDFQIQKRMKAIDFLIEGFRARRAQVAALPPIFDKISYFDYVDGIQSSVEDSRDVKKRSRLEWEDAVRTRTGKRPRPALPGTALRPTINSVAQAQLTDESKVALPSVLEDTLGAVSSVQKACQTFESEARGGVPQVNPLPRHKRPGSIRSYRSLNSDITNRPRLSPTVLPPISSAFHVPSGDNCFLRPRQLVNIGAFNVRTLRQIGQQAALASTVSSLELDVCCVSETRVYDSSTVIHLSSPLDSCRSKRFCLRVSGDAEAESRGQAGVGIALSSRAEQGLLDWIPVISRLCAVRLNTSVKICRRKSERRSIFIISACAPTDSCPDATKDAFYEALVDLLRQSKHSDIIILAGDFNAQLGRLSPDEKRLGGMFGVRAQRTDNGERLLQLCASHGKGTVTWRPPCASQPWTQLVHVAVSYRWRHCVKDCPVFWSNHLDSDHAVVRARFVLSFAQRTYARKCKVFN